MKVGDGEPMSPIEVAATAAAAAPVEWAIAPGIVVPMPPTPATSEAAEWAASEAVAALRAGRLPEALDFVELAAAHHGDVEPQLAARIGTVAAGALMREMLRAWLAKCAGHGEPPRPIRTTVLGPRAAAAPEARTVRVEIVGDRDDDLRALRAVAVGAS